ncbi:hypothetical protein ACP275_14G034200 [Erythranthe tilingii]
MASDNNQESSVLKESSKIAWKRLKCCSDKVVSTVMCPVRDAKNLGKQDPRRITHSCKVGLAVTLVSLLYYFDFLYDGFGVSAMWAVMTVIIIFDFTVGATLGKGVNRGVATLIGGALGLAAHRLTSFNGRIVEFSVLGFFIFLISALATFIRFFPKVKARYDYGLLVFILSFCLISVSGYRDDEVMLMAYRRLSTVMIGGVLTVFISIFVCPIWAGEDLHNLTANNIEKLGIFMEGFGRRYFETNNDKKQEKKASPDGYITVINSKSTEDTLVNVAKWEPRHGRFKYWHPWEQYLKIGANTRECAYKIDALNCYLNSKIQTSTKIREKIQEPCTAISQQCSHALRELSVGIKKMSCPAMLSDPHIKNAEAAAKSLESLLQNGKWLEIDFRDVIPAAAVALLLIEMVSCTAKLADSVHELASLSKFRAPYDNAVKANQTCLERVVVVTRVSDDHKVSLLC